MRQFRISHPAWIRTRECRGLVLGGAIALTGLSGTVAMNVRPESATPAADTHHVDSGNAAVSSAASSYAAVWDIANIEHDRVDYWVELFTGNRRAVFEKYYTRKGLYEEFISARLTEREMPQDLLYLAMIESGFNPKAYSTAAASGLWQFIRETGERYGLDVNSAIDERRDFVKSTDAALDYLAELYNRFGSWYLAAAAYNTGENRIGRIMREETGSERGTDADYYRIWERLPRETRDYVPLMIAAARISKDPSKYGFDVVPSAAPLTYKEVSVKPATPLKILAASAGTTVAAIKDLNPQLKLDRTRNDEPSVIRLPEGAAISPSM